MIRVLRYENIVGRLIVQHIRMKNNSTREDFLKIMKALMSAKDKLLITELDIDLQYKIIKFKFGLSDINRCHKFTEYIQQNFSGTEKGVVPVWFPNSCVIRVIKNHRDIEYP